MQIRLLEHEDAHAFLTLNHQLDGDTQMMLLEPNERTTTVEQIQHRIEFTVQQDNEVVFVAEVDGSLVGYASVIGGRLRRTAHKASIVTGVLQSHVGRGIGSKMFETLIEWATISPLHRLELTVMTHNSPAIALYQKFGFQIEGTKRHSLKVAGTYVDEYIMARVL